MKKILIFGFLFTFLMTAFSVDLDAQYSRKRKKKKKKKTTTEKNSEYFDESGGDIADKLWYGADGIFQFGSSNNQTQFIWGISPMVGYKFTDNFSAGPRLSFQNVIIKDSSLGSELSANLLNVGGGVWTRHKILQTYFVHAEFELLSEQFITGFDGTEAIKDRESNAHYYLGAGYGAGNESLGFSAYLLWDFSQDFNSQNIPLVYRIGITYKF